MRHETTFFSLFAARQWLFALFEFCLYHSTRLTMDTHAKILSSVCRVGGGRFSDCSHTTKYKVDQHAPSLLTAFKVDVTGDKADVHPQYFCSKCERTMARALAGASLSGGGCGVPVTWQAHSDTNCSVCKTPDTKKSKPGRPPKRKASSQKPELESHAHAPSTSASTHSTSTTQQHLQVAQEAEQVLSSGMDMTFEEIARKAMPCYAATIDLEQNRFIDSNNVQICKVCLCAVDMCIETPCCTELYCCKCLCQWLSKNNTCPTCYRPMVASTLLRPHPIVIKMISMSTIHCDYHSEALQGCPASVALQSLRQHVSNCPYKGTSALAMRTVRPSSTATEIMSASPSKLQGNVADKLMSHLVNARMDGDKLRVKTGTHGRQLLLQRTTVGEVPSSSASTSTLRRREEQMVKSGKAVCVGDEGLRAQQVAGLRRLSSAEQEKLLAEVGLLPSSPSPGTALAIKADLSLSYSKFRQLRRWLKSFGLELESEHSMRSFVAKQLPQYVAKNLPMMKKNGEIHMAAAVLFPDLISTVTFFLDKLEESNSLTWSNGIPETELWIKIGGDHGGGSFKLSFQVSV